MLDDGHVGRSGHVNGQLAVRVGAAWIGNADVEDFVGKRGLYEALAGIERCEFPGIGELIDIGTVLVQGEDAVLAFNLLYELVVSVDLAVAVLVEEDAEAQIARVMVAVRVVGGQRALRVSLPLSSSGALLESGCAVKTISPSSLGVISLPSPSVK